ncbi:GH36-type glycosyl hydrolase domain-containing protein [Parasphingorhabdus sp.]|uniref:GH36-type glycosyl hydrolase domain-containing protein n=1 Tax=Parasphingorhabdus sp. TaxID=2709688 RepID=UPI003593481B
MSQISGRSTASETDAKSQKIVDPDGAARGQRDTDEVGVLERAAADLHNHHKLSDVAPDPVPAWRHIDEAAEWLTRARKCCANAPTDAGKAAEWLLDNDYQVYRAIRQIREDLPSNFYAKLPSLEDEPKSRFPRVFAIAHTLLKVTHLQITLPAAIQFICAYQRSSPLTIAELWAFPTMLRIACLEILVSSLGTILHDQIKQPFALTSDAKVTRSLDDTERVARSIANLSLIATISWEDFFDQTSLVESILAKDPSQYYAQMDFETRDRYRRAIEILSTYSGTSEADLAASVVKRANAASGNHGDDHVGYWLIGPGRPIFEREAGLTPPLGLRLRRLAFDYAGPFYTLAQLSFWIGAFLIPAIYLWYIEASPVHWAGALLIMLLPASTLSISLVQRLATFIVPPKTLAKMDFSEALPSSCKTVVVIPALIGKADEISDLVQQSEAHWLSNGDRYLQVALLADLADAPAEHMPTDDEITSQLVEQFRSLNERHGSKGVGPFHLLLRSRRYNRAEDCWMAWERKRGKLEQFNRLIVEDDDHAFSIHEGSRQALSEIRFVITVDADTMLPTGSVRKLAGTLAHPLNVARFDPVTGNIVSGYSILQPRVEMEPQGVSRTFFTRFFAGDTAIDIYSRAVSNVYQDLFGIGIFVGKSIYDVAAFHRCIDGRVAENTILSHDLLEGALGRVALASDIVLYEGFPGAYLEYVKRWHRWVRGDWQLLPWLRRRVREADGQRRGNGLSALSRWMIVDNLRRSLVAPSLLFMLVIGWIFLPGNPWFWTLLAIFAHGGQIFTDLVTGLAQGRRRGAVRGLLAQMVDQAGRWFLAIVHLPFEASITVHAIAVTIWRILISKQKRLEWTTAAQVSVKQRNGHSRNTIWMQMWTGPVTAVAISIAIQIFHPASLPAAAPLLFLWFIAPEITLLLNKPSHKPVKPLDEEDRLFLRGLARRTWLYFETFAGPQDNWLPPDNYQGEPYPETAHRTSPTNIGMMMLSTASAWDFGYLGAEELAARTANTYATLDRLERHRGHFLNWYDTLTLQSLEPRYVSVVDSGNMAGCLIAYTSLLVEVAKAPAVQPQQWGGVEDILRLLAAALGRIPGNSDGLKSAVELLQSNFDGLAAKPLQWHGTLRLVLDNRISIFQELIVEAAAETDAISTADLREVHTWLDRLRHQLVTMIHDIETLAPWLALDEPSPELRELHGEVAERLMRSTDAALFDHLLRAIENARTEHPADIQWFQSLANAVAAGRKNQTALTKTIKKLAAKTAKYAAGMEFSPYYDRERRLFHIGYNVSADRLDPHYYDLLASEARLASYLAIAYKEVPLEHWFHLGRPVMRCDNDLGLVSWNGSMFEYLMPRLLMLSGPQTLLSESEKVAVKMQQKHGRREGVPWGVSESAYAARDPEHRYQYQAFGVPGLGLRRGLAKDLVIAPYASALALQVLPSESAANLKSLVKLGYSGLYGMLEAVDYTPERQEASTSAMAVNAYMAHHQGMILCAIGNSLCNDILVRRFARDARVNAVSLLLNERVPQELPSEVARLESVDLASRRPNTAPVSQKWQPPLYSRSPQVQLLGNGSLSSSISAGGGGGLQWRHKALTRFVPDPVRDASGLWIYLHDEEDGHLWSTTRQPTGQVPDQYDVTFHSHMAEFHRRDHDISVRMEAVVAAGDDIEIRRLNIGNLGSRPRSLRITSYGEVVLAPPLEDERHPAFSKLFVGSEFIPAIGGQLFTRRPRNLSDTPPVLLHFLVNNDRSSALVGHESDRRRFIGRNGTMRRPVGAHQGLSQTTGWTLDPIMALQTILELEPFEHKELCFVTVAAISREAAFEIAERHTSLPSIDWAINDTSSAAAHASDKLGLKQGQHQDFQALASLILYPHGNLRTNPPAIEVNRLGQPSLWGMALSGDYPILMLRTRELPDSLLPDLIRAHQLWRSQGLEVDLVILQSVASGYIEPVRDDLMDLLQEVNAQWMLSRNGGIHLLFADQIGPDQVRLVEAVSRIVIEDGQGRLGEQLERAFSLPPELPHFEPASIAIEEADIPPMVRPDNLLFDNGLGGFEPDGREYVIYLQPHQTTPAPWVNILANDGFGSVVTEAGGGFTWARNSGENRITAWTNDAVMDEPSEALYLRDEETAEIWTPTPGPAGREAACEIRHGAGYTDWRKISHGIEQDLRIFVPVDDPVKVIQLRLTNHTSRHRRVTATYYVDWLLGSLRSISRPTVYCSYEPEQHAIFARNHWNPDFAERTAFLAADQPLHAFTTSRQEFLGREGSLESPAGLRRWGLEGLAEAGSDPCGAFQVHLDLEPGGTAQVCFFLGQGEDDIDAKALVAKWKASDVIDPALEKLTQYWDELLGTVEVHTPDPAFDIMTNRWLLYQSMASRIMARAGFYQASGAIGYRDQLQDMMAFLHNDPGRVRDHILDCAAHQFEEGDVLHWWHPPSDKGVRTRCSDDLLWLPYVVCHYVEVTGDESILQEDVPFLHAPPLQPDEHDRYAGFETNVIDHSLFEHCQRALEKGLTRGRHNLPLIGAGDWNDGMDRIGHKGQGESVWLAWFAIVTASAFSRLAYRTGHARRADIWAQRAQDLLGHSEEAGWDGDWYRRAFDDEGHPWGSSDNLECRIDSISQSWALFAGADTVRTKTALEAAWRELVNDQDQIARLLWPPFEKTPRDPGYIRAYPPGIRENGGQYSHAATWLGIAFARSGQPDRAMQIFDMLNPVKRVGNPEQAEKYRVEPYVVAADIAGGATHGGRGGWTWYTGAAAWTWRLGVEEILGLKLRKGKLIISPSMPSEWNGYSAVYHQPTGALDITVERRKAGSNIPVEILVEGVEQTSLEVEFPKDGSQKKVLVRIA